MRSIRTQLAAVLLAVPFALIGCMAEAPPAESGSAASDAPGEVVGTGEATADGTVYGEALTDAPLVALGELCAKAEEFDGKRVRVEGLVTGVCAKRGCWINVGAEEGPDEVTFKVTDGVIVFPMSAQGKWAQVEGTASKLVLPVEKARSYLQHKAEEGGETFDPESVTEPLTLVRLAGHGAVIRDR